MSMLVGLLVVLWGFSGCASVDKLAATMTERGVTSCLYYNGSYGPFVGFHGISATGGATLAQCETLR